MKTKQQRSGPAKFITAGALALLISLVACAKKETTDDSADQDEPGTSESSGGGAQSKYGKMLEGAQDAADKANERARNVKDAVEGSSE